MNHWAIEINLSIVSLGTLEWHLYTLFIDIISSYVGLNDVTIAITHDVTGKYFDGIFTVKAAIYGQLTQPGNSFETKSQIKHKQQQTDNK